MTKAMRWGVGTLSFVSLVALGAFVGCSSDNNNNPPPADTDSGVSTTDSGTGDANRDTRTETESETSSETSSETGGDADAAPSPPDRQVDFVFASPDSAPQYMCLGGFAAADPTTVDAPTKSLGPFGIPDSTDKTKLKSGFPYGAVVPYGVTDPLVKAALSSLTVVAYFSTETTPPDPASTTYCNDLWKKTKTDASTYFIVPKGKVVAGTSWMLALAGCKAAPAAGDTTNACPATPNFKYEFEQLDTAAPTTFSGDGTGAKAGLQFYNLSNFPAVFQNADVYIQPMSAPTSDAGADADGGTATPAGLPILIAGGTGGGSKFEALSAPAVGVAPKGDPDSAVLLMVQSGTTPCTPGPACLTTIALPLDEFEAAYKAAGIPIGWNGKNNTIVLAGSPLPKTAGDPTSAPLILAWVPNNF